MKPEYDYGDILIKRVSNGWIAVTGNDNEDDKTDVYVYEDEDAPNWIAASLYSLLIDQFGCYMQSKRCGGIKISYSNLSSEQEELDYETENQK